MKRVKSVAVIGAGAAGLAAMKYLKQAGLEVTAFEINDRVGGQWVYTEETNVQSSMYASLTTNLSKYQMSFSDFPMDFSENFPMFPHHTQVADYLSSYATHFNLIPFIKFNSEVTHVAPILPDQSKWLPFGKHSQPIHCQWSVTYSTTARRTENNNNNSNNDSNNNNDHNSSKRTLTTTEEFDAVVLCNGHFTKPKHPEITGFHNFRGTSMHSHNYRTPDAVQNKRVVVMGSGWSGLQIADELSKVATVYHSTRSQKEIPIDAQQLALQKKRQLDHPATLIPVPDVSHIDESGAVVFVDGTKHEVDAFLFCTGYYYDFPFLQKGIVEIGEEPVYVYPVYQQIFHPVFQTLFFIGLPFKVVPFPLSEWQASWISHVLAETSRLPPIPEMFDEIEDEMSTMRRTNASIHMFFNKQRERQYFDVSQSQTQHAVQRDWNQQARTHFYEEIQQQRKS